MISTYIVLVEALVGSILLAFYSETEDQRHADIIYRYALLITPKSALFIYFIILIHF